MFLINDWYWIVGGDQANVWSSARAMSVPVSDADYTAWLIAYQPSQIATMDDLYNLFSGQFPPGSLPTYNADARYRKATGGVIVTSLSPVAFLTDPVSRNSLANANEYIKSTPGSTVNWKMADGSFIILSGAQLTTAVTAIATFVENCFACESTNLDAINGGTITTLQQIDDAFAAIANVFP
jgi:hypothetical protein